MLYFGIVNALRTTSVHLHSNKWKQIFMEKGTITIFIYYHFSNNIWFCILNYILWNLDIEFIHTLCEITIQINTSVHARRKYFETN